MRIEIGVLLEVAGRVTPSGAGQRKRDTNAMNALKVVLGGIINGVAIVTFVITPAIRVVLWLRTHHYHSLTFS